jgi:hypothetical protein
VIALNTLIRRRTGGMFALSFLLVTTLAVFPVTRLFADEGETSETTETTEAPSFQGVVQGLPSNSGLIGDWTVSGKVVHVSAATLLPKESGDPPITVGSSVDVQGVAQTDGSIVASVIDQNLGSNSNTEQQGEN